MRGSVVGFLAFAVVHLGTISGADQAGDRLRAAVSPFGNIEEFPPVEAKYVRFVILETNGAEPCLDEIEVFTAEPDPRNIALRDAGSKPFASSSVQVGSFHQLRNLNDGRYGNDFSWLGGAPSFAADQTSLWWVQIEFPQIEKIDRIVWSRDRTGKEVTRTPIRYQIAVSLDAEQWKAAASSDDRAAYPNIMPLPVLQQGRTLQSFWVENWGLEDGLPSASVIEVDQTHDGYIWLATDRGLVRFDGNQFKVFDRNNTPELPSSNVRGVYCDPSGRLWIQAALELDDREKTLIFYENGRFRPVETHGQSVHWVRADSLGTPWVCTDRGIFPWPKPLTETPLFSEEVAAGISAVIGPAHELWLMYSNHLGRLINGRWKAAAIEGPPLEIENQKTLRGGRGPRPSGWIVVGGILPNLSLARGPNVYRRILPNGSVTAPRLFPWSPQPFETIATCEDLEGHLWIASGFPDYALYRMSPDGSRYEKYSEELADPAISSLSLDRGGNLWASTFRGGISILRRRSFQTLPLVSVGQKRDVVSIAPAPGGGVWLCANGNGLFKWNEGLFRLYTAKAPWWSVLEDAEGGVWVGGEAWGGERYFGGQWTIAVPQIATDPAGSAAFLQDRAGRVWMGGYYGVASYEQGQARVFRPPFREGVGRDSATALAEGRAGDIFVGTKRGTLFRLRDGSFKRIWESTDETASPICALRMDVEGALWFSRFGHGISRWEDDRITHYGLEQGLPATSINGMVEDLHGSVWFTSKAGVFLITQQDFRRFARGEQSSAIRWRRFTKNDGLPSLECHGDQNQPALCRTADGKIWVPTTQGVAVADPVTIIETALPSVVINEVLWYGPRNRARHLLEDGDYPRQSNGVEITVPAGQIQIEIRYTGIDFSDPKLVRFRYRLQGLAANWIDAQDSRAAMYSSLKPGSYRFEVVALGKDGLTSQPAGIGLNVLPLWWQTWTFRGLVGALFLLSGPAFYLHRVRRLKQKHERQASFARQLIAREEAERKRIAQEIHDVLGHDLLLLKNSAVQGAQDTAVPIPQRERFERISGLASRTLDEARGISHQLRPPELDRLGFREAIEALIEKAAGTGDLRVFKELDSLDGVLAPETQVYLFRLIQEGLNNILKHARASTIMLEITRDTDHIRIKLEDDGTGFDVADVQQRRAGIGLIGMEERVKLAGGQFEISSAPGRGTRVRITIPVAPSARP